MKRLKKWGVFVCLGIFFCLYPSMVIAQESKDTYYHIVKTFCGKTGKEVVGILGPPERSGGYFLYYSFPYKNTTTSGDGVVINVRILDSSGKTFAQRKVNQVEYTFSNHYPQISSTLEPPLIQTLKQHPMISDGTLYEEDGNLSFLIGWSWPRDIDGEANGVLLRGYIPISMVSKKFDMDTGEYKYNIKDVWSNGYLQYYKEDIHSSW